MEKHFCDKCNKEIGNKDYGFVKFQDGREIDDEYYEFCDECFKKLYNNTKEKSAIIDIYENELKLSGYSINDYGEHITLIKCGNHEKHITIHKDAWIVELSEHDGANKYDACLTLNELIMLEGYVNELKEVSNGLR